MADQEESVLGPIAEVPAVEEKEIPKIPATIDAEVSLVDSINVVVGKFFVVAMNDDETVDISAQKGGPVFIPSCVDNQNGTVRLATTAEINDRREVTRPNVHSLEEIRRGGFSQVGVAEQMRSREVFLANAWDMGARTVGTMRAASLEYERLLKEGKISDLAIEPATPSAPATTTVEPATGPTLAEEEAAAAAIKARFAALAAPAVAAPAPASAPAHAPTPAANAYASAAIHQEDKPVPPLAIIPRALTTAPITTVASAGVAGQNGSGNPGQPRNPTAGPASPNACKRGCKLNHIHQT